MLGYLKDQMHVDLRDHHGNRVLGFRQYAEKMVAKQLKLIPDQARRLHLVADLPTAAAGASGTFEETLREIGNTPESTECMTSRSRRSHGRIDLDRPDLSVTSARLRATDDGEEGPA